MRPSDVLDQSKSRIRRAISPRHPAHPWSFPDRNIRHRLLPDHAGNLRKQPGSREFDAMRTTERDYVSKKQART
jgi:hypothetical protein